MASLEPKTGDIVTLANARWAVIYNQGAELRLLRLNDQPEPEPEQPKHQENSLSVEQVAEELGIAPKTVRGYCRTGQLKGRKVGNNWRVLRSENPILAMA